MDVTPVTVDVTLVTMDVTGRRIPCHNPDWEFGGSSDVKYKLNVPRPGNLMNNYPVNRDLIRVSAISKLWSDITWGYTHGTVC